MATALSYIVVGQKEPVTSAKAWHGQPRGNSTLLRPYERDSGELDWRNLLRPITVKADLRIL
jgi:hypothetical protein